jgi:hypothetical protein
VRHLLNILAYLMLVLSLGTTATAHVLERPDVSTFTHQTGASENVDGHTPGDSDQVPADEDKGYPHHHGGCHGDHIAAPIKLSAATHTRHFRLTPVRVNRVERPLSAADPALRPPQA